MTTAAVEAEIVDDDDLGLSFFEDKTDATSVDDPDPTIARLIEMAETFLPPDRPGRLTRIWRHVVRTFARLRAAAARSDVQVVAYARRYRRRRPCGTRVGLHRAERRWFGRRRSTSERNVARAVTSRAAAKEGDLPHHPPEFIDWVTNFIETLRGEQLVLHPAQHRQWEGITYVNHPRGTRRVGQVDACAGAGLILGPYDLGQDRDLAR